MRALLEGIVERGKGHRAMPAFEGFLKDAVGEGGVLWKNRSMHISAVHLPRVRTLRAIFAIVPASFCHGAKRKRATTKIRTSTVVLESN